MGILDFDERYKPPYTPKRISKEVRIEGEVREVELNNFNRKKLTEDFGDSPFADRKSLPSERN